MAIAEGTQLNETEEIVDDTGPVCVLAAPPPQAANPSRKKDTTPANEGRVVKYRVLRLLEMVMDIPAN